ncbi:DUF1302 domain-containing protein [Telluria aromaticivorans]|uniref:DUF1302 domain-containing protein n=1 Tax=Telluria aromaticivorans TaxID=2725995 RepID=A0A7Y2JYE0_9BURK|nr:DUF1302 family protein [Telluria aromaticivorans]NNG23272.1 DUF1302 domain-containing protein [Telluria aromaticivorans]
MTREATAATGVAILRTAIAVALAAAAAAPSLAAGITASGRLMAGNIYRVQDRDPQLLTGVNAATLGLPGYGSGGNADDASTNYAKGDAVSRMVKAVLEVSAQEGDWAGLVRVKAWHDRGLSHDGRPWGNVPNRYAAGAPLSDSGAPRLSRFSGVALLDAWVERRFIPGGTPVVLRLGQQTLGWGSQSLTPGGLEALDPRDMPGQHRAGPVALETVVPRPMLFGRVQPTPNLAIEAYYQTAFRPAALDQCGTIWSMSDYIVDGCDIIMSGQPVVSDRSRLVVGSFKKRLPTPKPEAKEFGAGFTWRPDGLAGTEFGLYHARYNGRMAMPGLRRSTRPNGPALIAGDPDGRNQAYYSEYPEGLRISAATLSHKRGPATLYGELSYRDGVPFMLAPGDVMPPFLSATAPSLLRARANAVPPGGLFRGFDLYAMWQAQFGVRGQWTLAGMAVVASVEAVGKHARGLPEPSVMRYGRADIFGAGAVFGACSVHTGDAARQCSLRGYATPNSWGYRLRADARLPAMAPQLVTSASVLFVHDVKGWSGDLLLNEGRKSVSMALRFEYRERYLAELGYQPTWGGDYHQAADRDTASVAVGVRF